MDKVCGVMPAGKYYVGDLCYVLRDSWDEVCDLIFSQVDELNVKSRTDYDGVFTLKDGRKFAIQSTHYGDGCYRDGAGKEYCVDAGSIGCILLEDCDDASDAERLGAVYEFSSNFIVQSYGECSELCFGGVSIWTGFDDDDEEDEYDDEW